MNVSAKDQGTGREQSMVITGGSALPKEDIEKMMRDAEDYAEEDRRRKEEAEVRNQADTLAYSTEKFLRENDEKVPEELKTEVNDAVAEVKKALEGTDVDAIKGSAEKLAQVSQKMGAAMYAQNPEGAQAGADDPGPTAARRAASRRTTKWSTPRSWTTTSRRVMHRDVLPQRGRGEGGPGDPRQAAHRSRNGEVRAQAAESSPPRRPRRTGAPRSPTRRPPRSRPS